MAVSCEGTERPATDIKHCGLAGNRNRGKTPCLLCSKEWNLGYETWTKFFIKYHSHKQLVTKYRTFAAQGSEFPDNSVTSHLFADGRRPDTAFQRYRNSRLGGEFHSEITGRTLTECLDECLRQASFQCRSAVYSDRFRTCRLSRYNQRDGFRIIYDADYDYYENLMSE